MSRTPRTARGAALPAALVLVAVAGAVSAAVATLARTEVVLARNREAAAHALAAADGCVAAVTADLPVGWEFDGLVAGPDGVAGTADDGVRPAPADCTARLSPAPGGTLPSRALLDVAATAAGGRRRIEAVVTRAAPPGVPALLWLADAATLGDLDGTLALDGGDAGRPGAPALAPLAAPGDPAGLDAWLAAQAGRVTVAPGGPAPLGVSAPPLAELAVRLRDAGAAPGGTLVPAGTPPLVLTLVAGDLVTGASALGSGLLFVDGRLDIGGSFAFNGVVVATRGIRVAGGARLGVAGGIWLGAGATLVVEGEARVSARADAVDAADGLLRLPRRALLAGLRDPP
jgi:hypothetical protein